MAAHARHRKSVLVVYVVFVHMYSFADLIRRTPPPTCSDTAITDRHSDTTKFQLITHWVRISWSIGSEKIHGSDMCRRWESNPRLPARTANTLFTGPGAPLYNYFLLSFYFFLFVLWNFFYFFFYLYFYFFLFVSSLYKRDQL